MSTNVSVRLVIYVFTRYKYVCSKFRFNGLDKPLKLRKEALEESLRFHKFGFELETELGWIREHLPLVESTELGTNLHQAQTLHKKHKKLEAEIQGHQPMINKTLESGQALIHQKHPETKQVSVIILLVGIIPNVIRIRYFNDYIYN